MTSVDDTDGSWSAMPPRCFDIRHFRTGLGAAPAGGTPISTPSITLPDPLIVDPRSWRGRLLVPVLAYVGLLLALVSSLGAPLIPTIATDYGVSLSTAQWSLTITLLVGAVSAPVIGRLGDGPRRLPVLLVALGLLIAGLVLAALPFTVFALLVAGRALQGLGLALLPLAMGVARDHLVPEQARPALATLSVTAVVGLGLGYPFTGVIAEHLGFHAAFWVAAGLALLALVLCAVVVPPSRHRRSSPFDRPGLVLMAVWLVCVLLAISQGEDWGWGSPRIGGLLAVAVVALAAWVRHELRAAHPLVDLRLVRNRTVLTADVTAVLAGMGLYMLLSMVIRYVQTPASTGYGLAASVVVGGLVLLPMSAASFLASRFVPGLANRTGSSRMLAIGAVFFALALVMFATLRSDLWQIFVVMGITGLGTGCLFAVMPRMIVSAVPGEETGAALALNQVLRTIGYSLGSAVGATVLAAHTHAPDVLPQNSGYSLGAWTAVGLCLVAALAALILPSRCVIRLDQEQELLVEEATDAAVANVIGFEPEDVPETTGSAAR
ncbi:MFS transporter [Kineosporia mesophila]|nr:MFS transporter [Kineosporia mesophila]MCD5354035.1 MFS transporter [Kineosporia mesophila]